MRKYTRGRSLDEKVTVNDIEIAREEEDTARMVCESIRRAYEEYVCLWLVALAWLALAVFCVWYVVMSYHDEGKARTSDGASVERTTIDAGGVAR